MMWTDERIERLTSRWAEGASCSVIAAELGGVSRAAISGKVNRLGLPRRPSIETARGHHAIRQRHHRSNRDVVGLIMNHAADRGKESKVPVEPAVYRCTLLELTNESCRWPIGDGPTMFFCGSPNADLASNIPYCGFHSRYAYQVRSR